jgi:large subunit ribosomal protein L23
MALFSRKKKADAEVEASVVGKVATKALSTDRDLTSVIVSPRITEKAVGLGDKNVYTFTIRTNATKFLVRDAIKALYGVTPVKINIVNKKPAVRLAGARSRMVKVPGEKKAYVYLKKGDTINLV